MSETERAAAFGQVEPPPLAASQNAIRHVVAVMSGKGGVGKTLVTGLLAAGLNRAGYNVGVLDADVTGDHTTEQDAHRGLDPKKPGRRG